MTLNDVYSVHEAILNVDVFGLVTYAHVIVFLCHVAESVTFAGDHVILNVIFYSLHISHVIVSVDHLT